MEWLIAAGAVLGTVFGSAVVVFRRSLEKAREGGRSKVEHVRAEAERIRARANALLLETEVKAPGLRTRAQSAEQAGTQGRTADEILERQRAAEASARRSAQSFNAALGQHRRGFDVLRDVGLLRDGAAGPTVDVSRPPARAREDAAELGRLIQELEWFRVNGDELGISGPLSTPVAITEGEVASIRAELSRPDRVDKRRIHALTHAVPLGRDLLAESPDRPDRAGEGLSRGRTPGTVSGSDPLKEVPTTLTAALEKQRQRGTGRPEMPRRLNVEKARQRVPRPSGPKP
ncbi:hypothetical protein ACIBFB_07190 [Nocardiopsis sp. NPDC050513]|uniref:hypothetical protein n=1 Tax=Nocardiopsis sp. NPDC050513 TaxID=3364338 RepID=UPI0037B22C00